VTRAEADRFFDAAVKEYSREVRRASETHRQIEKVLKDKKDSDADKSALLANIVDPEEVE
jgi:hypothetical protein